MAELQRADQQARHDLVADAQAQHGVEHVVRQRDGGRQRDHVAAEQRQLHAGLALRHAVAHRRHAARELRDGTRLARRLLDDRRESARTAGAPTACRCTPRRCRCSAVGPRAACTCRRPERGEGVGQVGAAQRAAQRTLAAACSRWAR